jgi:hypothetical protein
MTEPKDEAKEAKTQVERLKSEYGAEDMGTYMDARVEGKPIRVAVWNEGLKSYQPTEEGVALLATPKAEKPKAEEKGKPKGKTEIPPPPPGSPFPSAPPPPPGTHGPTG